MANDLNPQTRGRGVFWGWALVVAVVLLLLSWLFRFPWGLLPPQQ
jgi:hypothetical protein